jgi:hypothetical protein
MYTYVYANGECGGGGGCDGRVLILFADRGAGGAGGIAADHMRLAASRSPTTGCLHCRWWPQALEEWLMVVFFLEFAASSGLCDILGPVCGP